MYVVGTTNDTVFQYALTTPWSRATASYESISFSVAVEEITPIAVFFKPNGLSMYITGNTSDGVYQYTLSTAWNVSTATYLQTFSVAGQESNPQDISFTGDGTRMSVLGSTGDDVNVYNLTTPWDISTASSVGAVSVAGQETVPTGLYIKPDGTKMYVVGTNMDTVFQYTVPSVEIQLTGTTSINGSATVEQDLTVNGDFNTSGSITSTAGSNNSFAGNVILGSSLVVYAPTPASFSALATLTNANLQTQIITATGSGVAFTLTMPLGTTLETLISWSAVNLGYDFLIINTAIATVTMGANTGVTIVGADTILSGTSARFRIRRTAANTFVLYRIS